MVGTWGQVVQGPGQDAAPAHALVLQQKVLHRGRPPHLSPHPSIVLLNLCLIIKVLLGDVECAPWCFWGFLEGVDGGCYRG